MVNLDNVEEFITSDKFANFVLSNTTDFGGMNSRLNTFFEL